MEEFAWSLSSPYAAFLCSFLSMRPASLNSPPLNNPSNVMALHAWHAPLSITVKWKFVVAPPLVSTPWMFDAYEGIMNSLAGNVANLFDYHTAAGIHAKP